MIPQIKIETKCYALILPVEYAITGGACHILHTPSKKVLCIGEKPTRYNSMPFINYNPQVVRQSNPLYLMGDPTPRAWVKGKRYTVCPECRRVAEGLH